MIKIVSDGQNTKVYAYDKKNVMRELKDVVSVEISKIDATSPPRATLVLENVQLDLQAEEEVEEEKEPFDDEDFD